VSNAKFRQQPPEVTEQNLASWLFVRYLLHLQVVTIKLLQLVSLVLMQTPYHCMDESQLTPPLMID
jgi:hypothetical protein